MRLFPLLFAAIFWFENAAVGQDSTRLSDLKIGEWQQHLPWQRATWVTQSDEKVWFATEWAVVELNKSDRAPRFFSKTEGLSEVGMGVIKYDPVSSNLILTYKNSNIDLLKNGLVTNLPAIKNNSAILGDKRVYDIFLQGNAAWLSCGFGISKLRLDVTDFEFTTFTNVPVRGFTAVGDFYYAATDDGIFKVPTAGVNLADFSNWKLLGPDDGFPADYASKTVVSYQNRLYFELNGDLFRLSANGQPELFYKADSHFYLKFLTAENKGLVAGFDCKKDDDCPWPGGPIVYFETPDSPPQTLHDCINHPNYAVEDGQKRIWNADGWDEFRVVNLTGGCEQFHFNSPKTERSQQFLFANDETFVAAGTVTQQPDLTYNNDGFYTFKNNEWTRFNSENQPKLQLSEFIDCWRLTWDATRKRVWLASFSGGIAAFDPEKKEITDVFDRTNSALQLSGGQTIRTFVSGLEFDKNQNLWIANFRAPNPIVVLKKDNSWKTFASPNIPSGEAFHLKIDANDYKWYSIGTTGGLYVLDSGADLDSPADDQTRVINSSNSVLPSNRVNCFANDLDGDMWVGTDKGVCSFQCGSNIFDASCKGSLVIINVDGFNSYLLANEDVRVIAVDGANRKWIGTTNGLYIFSPDGRTEIEHFTSKNSPLFDDVITDVAINSTNGDVWIGTEKGILTLRGEATDGKKVQSPTTFAYPNPVRPDYDGPIGIYGLARDSNIKITDSNGQLVFETKALGGQAIWDGRDYQGRRAASGVYLVFATGTATFDAPDAKVVAKIILVN